MMPAFLRRPAALFALIAALFALAALPAAAQDRVWVQIEAQPTLDEATDRARAYAAIFPETQGYRLRSGWYGIVLGPYGVAEGAAQLAGLKGENMIPGDSFITDGGNFRDSFWPAGAEAAPTPLDPPAEIAAEPLPEATAPEAAPEAAAVEPAPAPVEEPEETVPQARASEAALTEDERKELQVALQWYGFYAGGIDGAYGPGTRKSMAAWQEAMGLDATGVLTTRQRATLVANYRTEIAAYGFATVNEAESGIEATLPLNLVEFDRYEPPFVHFKPKNGSDLSIVLISQPGDIGAFYGLYDILQSLEDMPEAGERTRSEKEFRIHGSSASRDSHAYARFEGGFIKGWMVLSVPQNAERDARLLQVLEQSFRPVGSTALDPGLVPLDDAARRGLLAGLEVRKPRFSRSGFFVSAEGAVLTTAEAVAQCGHVTIDRETAATVTLSDAATGLALLVPEAPLAPPGVAQFQIAPDRIGAEVAVAGYSYEDRLPAPVLTWGTLEDLTGLNGEPGVKRLALSALPGDAGGPVIDATGAVLGMLLPQAARQGAQQLPEGVSFAAAAASVQAVLAAQGIALVTAESQGALPPEDLTRIATGMTVLVSCWD
jgi:peptidoglycan hydrolase-like protein with peptidoglycan-binding domain/S1-C subfamily serine protease